MYELNGKIKLINDTQSFPSGFTKREFVVTSGDDKYPQDIKFEIVKDKCAVLDNFSAGQNVSVSFDVRGNEYNGKYYVNLNCWKIQAADGTGGGTPAAAASPFDTGAPVQEPSIEDLNSQDDIPF